MDHDRRESNTSWKTNIFKVRIINSKQIEELEQRFFGFESIGERITFLKASRDFVIKKRKAWCIVYKSCHFMKMKKITSYPSRSKLQILVKCWKLNTKYSNPCNSTEFEHFTSCVVLVMFQLKECKFIQRKTTVSYIVFKLSTCTHLPIFSVVDMIVLKFIRVIPAYTDNACFITLINFNTYIFWSPRVFSTHLSGYPAKYHDNTKHHVIPWLMPWNKTNTYFCKSKAKQCSILSVDWWPADGIYFTWICKLTLWHFVFFNYFPSRPWKEEQ